MSEITTTNIPGGITSPSQDMNSTPGTVSATVGASGSSG